MILRKQIVLICEDEEKMCGSLVKHPTETKHLGSGLLVPLHRQVANDCCGHYAGLLACKAYVTSQAGIFPIVSLILLKLLE